MVIDSPHASRLDNQSRRRNIRKVLIIILWLPFFILLTGIVGGLSVLFPRIMTSLLIASLLIFCSAVAMRLILKKMHLIFLKMAIVSMTVCAAIWISMFWLGAFCDIMGWRGIRAFSTSTCFPLGEACTFDVGPDGSVFWLVEFYYRVQVYDNTGRFVKGWFVPFGRGTFRLRVLENKSVQICSSCGTRCLTYDYHGNLITNVPAVPLDEGRSKYEAHDSAGNVYRLVSPHLVPKIIRTSPSGQVKVLISDSFARWFLKAPLPAFPFGAIAFFVAVFFMMHLKDIKLTSKSEGQLKVPATSSSCQHEKRQPIGP